MLILFSLTTSEVSATTVKCLIPEDCRYYDIESGFCKNLNFKFENEEVAAKILLSVYYRFSVDPNSKERADIANMGEELPPVDEEGLGLLDKMLSKLQRYFDMRKVSEALPELKRKIRSGEMTYVAALQSAFTLQQMRGYGY